MGTSSARRAPTSWLWRRAKGAATRYLAPDGGLGLEAQEVVAHYLAALQEDAGSENRDILAAFRLTRKTGQNLGALLDEAASRGWDAALASSGVKEVGNSWEMAAAALAGALLEEDGSLEGAVARSSLAAVLQEIGPDREARAVDAVIQFLTESIYQRLILDLGEPLEAAGRSFGHWRQGLDGLKSCIAGAATAGEPKGPPGPKQWRGLAGWTWVTRFLERILHDLLMQPSSGTPR